MSLPVFKCHRITKLFLTVVRKKTIWRRHIFMAAGLTKPLRIWSLLSEPVAYSRQMWLCRTYRVKTPALLEGGQRWMLHVYKEVDPSATSLTPEMMSLLRSRVELLEERGCKSYQLVECPQVLQLDIDEVDARIERLHQCGITHISAPLINLAKQKSPSKLAGKVADYKEQKTGGHVSIADFWLEKFQCSKDDIVDAVGRNPRLFRSNIKAMCEKIDILLRYGATLDDVRAHSHVLKNRTVATIETRARELSRLCAPPLSVAWIAQSEYIYQEILHNYATAEDEQADKLSYIEKQFGGADSTDNIDLWRKIPYVNRQQFRVLRPKLEFLRSKGFTHDDIIMAPYIFKLGLESMRAIYNELEEHGIETITLRLICTFSQRRAISKYRLPTHILAKVIGCAPETIDPLPKEMRVMFLQATSVMSANFRFLRDECGFDRDHVRRLPVILGHDHALLRKHWSALPHEDELQPYEEWTQDKWRLLNVMQYFIERENNFKHPVVFSNDESETVATDTSPLS